MFVVDPSQMTLFGLESRSLELNHAFSQHLENDLRVAYYCRGFMLDEMKDMLVWDRSLSLAQSVESLLALCKYQIQVSSSGNSKSKFSSRVPIVYMGVYLTNGTTYKSQVQVKLPCTISFHMWQPTLLHTSRSTQLKVDGAKTNSLKHCTINTWWLWECSPPLHQVSHVGYGSASSRRCECLSCGRGLGRSRMSTVIWHIWRLLCCPDF